MATAIQRLPSLVIPGPGSLQQKSMNSKITDKDLEYFNAFRYRLPPVSSSKAKSNARCQPNYWAYGTSYLVTLLFNGQLPKSFLHELCEESKNSKPPHYKETRTLPLREREVELWAPKNYRKIQSSARRSEQKIMEARWRQREKLEAISSRIIDKNAKGDAVILRKEATMERGKKAYLLKIERQCKAVKSKGINKRVCPTPAGESEAEQNIFELTEVTDDEEKPALLEPASMVSEEQKSSE